MAGSHSRGGIGAAVEGPGLVRALGVGALALIGAGLIAACGSARVAATTLAPRSATTLAPRSAASDIHDRGFPTHTFYSESSLHPPIVSVSGRDPDPASGDIFVDAQNTIQPGPMILDPQGGLIWFEPLRGWAYGMMVQRYQGQTVLTYSEIHGRAKSAEDVILNHSYQSVAVVRARDGYRGDTHEFQITPQGTALILAQRIVRADLSSIGGSRDGKLVDEAIQEIDIKTGRLLWQWRAYGHLPLSDSYAGKPGKAAYVAYHLNSIQQLPNGNLLVSARHTWAVYEISRRTGRILWTLGGKHSSFKMGPGTNFEWQHDARLQSDGTMTLFDNAAAAHTASESQSRALRIRLNFKTMRATLVRAYEHKPPLLSKNQGNLQVLPDGNIFVGWGGKPYFSEFGPNGKQLFSMNFGYPLQSYRAFRFAWSGQPTTPPSIAVKRTTAGARVYASWNGATDVAAWRVLAGGSATSLTTAGQFPRMSFETAMSVPSTGPDFAVQALDSSGHILSTSAVVARP